MAIKGDHHKSDNNFYNIDISCKKKKAFLKHYISKTLSYICQITF